MNIRKDMTCEQVEALLGALADGELNNKQAAAVRAHLDRCPSCARKLAELERMSSLLSDAVAAEPLPSALHDSVMRVVRTERPARESARRGAWRQWSTVAACALCFVVVALALLSNGGGLKMESALDHAPTSPDSWMDSSADEDVSYGGADKGETAPEEPMMPDAPSEPMEPSVSPNFPTADEAQIAYKLCRADGTTAQALDGEWIGEELRMIFDEQTGSVEVAYATQGEMRLATYTARQGVLTLVYSDGASERFAFEWEEGVLWLIRQ